MTVVRALAAGSRFIFSRYGKINGILRDFLKGLCVFQKLWTLTTDNSEGVINLYGRFA